MEEVRTGRSARRACATAVLAVLFALLPAPSAGAADLSFTFEGGGFGHSVGMSQFGAYGMSRAGYTSDEILEHYFTGATPAVVDPAFSGEPIWVNLLMEKTKIDLTVRGIGDGDHAKVSFTSSAGRVRAAEGETVRITRLSNGSCRVSGPRGTMDGPCVIDADWDGFEDEPTAAVVLEGCTKINWNLPTGGRAQPCTYARGALRVRPDNNTAAVDLSLEIDMEDYVLGISEMPYYWAGTGGVAALEAQAVAARSYAYSKVLGRAAPSSRPWCWCSLYDTPVDQNYVGWGHGTQEWVDAVRATEGVVMTHPSVTRNGELAPIPTYYSSSTFGWTEDSENGFSAFVPYLRSVDDHWGVLPEVGNSNARWLRTFGAGALAAALPGMYTVTDMAITRCSTTGAALEVTFYGSGGPRSYPTNELRKLLSLRSMQIISITGSGVSESCSTGGGTTTTTTTTTTTVPASTTTTSTTVPASATTTTSTTIPATTTTTIPATAVSSTWSAGTTDPKPACEPAPNVETLLAERVALWAGASGRSVAELQAFLAAIGFDTGPADGVFGARTEAALRAFQDDQSLTADGVVGPQTREAIAGLSALADNVDVLRVGTRLLSIGISGDDVAQLQRLLRLLGFDTGPADGVFGPQTDQALRSFQRTNQLMIDGILGAGTRRTLIGTTGLAPLTACG